MARIPIPELLDKLTALFSDSGVPLQRARRLAELFTQASADGVCSHGVHFVPGLLKQIRSGQISNLQSNPEQIASFGSLQRYDAHRGLGPLAAEFCIDRAMDLAENTGVACVALRNTTHWGRPGNLGWRAADRGFLAICWTNTPPLMPPYGGTEKSIGNNPIVLAAPGPDGHHLVLDMAMSQFSIGKMNAYKAEQKPLPEIGGQDSHGRPTTDPAAILDDGLPYPIGFWKGSGLAILLDAFAAILADGAATDTLGTSDVGVSQVFIALAPEHLNGQPAAQRTAEILKFLAEKNPQSRYPGQGALAHRTQSQTQGVWVRDEVWKELTSLPAGCI
jgi:3-dehydro-L-gulonate 2-dehydrogenase